MKTLVLLLCCFGDVQFSQTAHDKIPLYGTQGEAALVVEAGETVDITGERTELDLLVRGTLRLQPGVHLKARTITAVDGGTIEITEPATITIRDMPLNTEMDPSQYGHGLLVVNGTLTTHAPSWRQAFAQLASEVKAGDATLTFAVAPHGWQAGDKLVLPDTRQPTTGADLSAQTETSTIASIDGATVTLMAPVQFAHLGWHKSDGSVGLLPDVACLAQPIVIRSENPNGVRGHVLITAASHQDVEGVGLVDMGRTTSAPLHSTLRDDQGNIAQIGTNQIGRYSWHHHHLLGRRNNGLQWQFRLEHVSVDGSPKWGVAVHGSHFGLVNDCAVYNAAGSGIVTEDPWVYGNKITNNIVIAKQVGSNQRITDRAGRNLAGGDHWHDRGGLGLASAMNAIAGNRLYCCKESIGMAGFGTSVLYAPSEPGVCSTCSAANRTALPSHMGRIEGEPRRYPFVFDTSGNVAWGGWRGIETWTADCYPGMEKMFPGLTLVHLRYPTDFEDQEETAVHGWRLLGDFAQANAPTAGGDADTFALNWKPAYRRGITVEDAEIRGYDASFNSDTDKDYVRFNRCTFETPTIVYQPNGSARETRGCDYEFSDCTFDGAPLFIDGQYPKFDLKLWLKIGRPERQSLLPVRYYVTPWHDGLDYQVYHYEQRADWSLPALADPTKAYGDWPAGVNTHAQLIELGTPIFGGVVPETAVPWGKFWADDQTPCERKVQILEQRIRELEGQ